MLLQLIHHNAHAFFTSVASAMSSFLSAGIHFLKTWLAHSANFCLWSNGKHRCELRGQFQAWTGRTWWGSHLRRIVRPGTRSEALWPASKAIVGDVCFIDLPLRDMDGRGGKLEQFADIVQNFPVQGNFKIDANFLDMTVYPLCAQAKYRELPEPFNLTRM